MMQADLPKTEVKGSIAPNAVYHIQRDESYNFYVGRKMDQGGDFYIFDGTRSQFILTLDRDGVMTVHLGSACPTFTNNKPVCDKIRAVKVEAIRDGESRPAK
jgi:hypothetical protein